MIISLIINPTAERDTPQSVSAEMSGFTAFFVAFFRASFGGVVYNSDI